jgi:hypothetical protein
MEYSQFLLIVYLTILYQLYRLRKVSDDLQNRIGVEGAVVFRVKILSQHVPGGTEENHYSFVKMY